MLRWAASDPPQLSDEARSVLEDGANDADVSVVSAWEISIKQSLGKLSLARPAEVWVPDAIRRMTLESRPWTSARRFAFVPYPGTTVTHSIACWPHRRSTPATRSLRATTSSSNTALRS